MFTIQFKKIDEYDHSIFYIFILFALRLDILQLLDRSSTGRVRYTRVSLFWYTEFLDGSIVPTAIVVFEDELHHTLWSYCWFLMEIWYESFLVDFSQISLFTHGSSGQPNMLNSRCISRQSAPCNRNNFTVGNPRTWSVIFTVDFSYVFGVFHLSKSQAIWRKERDVSPLSYAICQLSANKSQIASWQRLCYIVSGSAVDDEWFICFIYCSERNTFGKNRLCRPRLSNRLELRYGPWV